MAVGYRAILRLNENQNAVVVAEDQLRSWFREKVRGRNATLKKSDWDGPGIHKLGPQAELHVVHDLHDEGNTTRRLYRLVETNSTGTWTVSLYVGSLPTARDYPQTIVVDVDLGGADRATALAKVDPPKIVRALLDTVGASDGSTVLTGAPVVIRPGDVTDVVDAIKDPDRTASVVVASSFDRSLDDGWKTAVTSLTRQSVGVAATYVVFADAVKELDAALPDTFRVGAGRIRTYLPRADVNDPTDSTRHKWLGPATFQRSLSGKSVAVPLQRRHAEVARRRFVEAELPTDVRRIMGLLRRAETDMERAVRVAERTAEERQIPRPVDKPLDLVGKAEIKASVSVAEGTDKELVQAPTLWLDAVSKVVQRWLGIHSPELSHVEKLDTFISAKVAEVEIAEDQLGDAALREEELQGEVEELRRVLEDRELDLAQVEQDEIEVRRELTILRNRIAASANPDTFVPPDDVDWDAPDTVEELISRITAGAGAHIALKHVQFTGDPEYGIEVDRRYPSGLYAKTLWQYVRVLYDFAEARLGQGFNGNVHMYLIDDTVDGTKCSPSRHAATESETVLKNSSWRQQRVLPVPVSVDREGFALMDAHFKPTHKDTFAPRMHYFDDVANSGKVYVGYIGRHLTNKQS